MATQIFFIFTPKIGEMIQFDEHIFQMGWFNHQPVVGLILDWFYLPNIAPWDSEDVMCHLFSQRSTSGRYIIFLQIDLEYTDLDYIQIATAALRIRGYMIDISNGFQDSCLLL